jgi:hypothetical protein
MSLFRFQMKLSYVGTNKRLAHDDAAVGFATPLSVFDEAIAAPLIQFDEMDGGLGGVEPDLPGAYRSGLFLNQADQARADAAPLQRWIDRELTEMGNVGMLEPR